MKPAFFQCPQILNRNKVVALRRLFQKPNVSLRFGFACVIWDKVEQFGGNPHSSLFHSHFAMYQYHWKQNIPSAWCYHHRAWQLAQCSHFWKPPNIPLLAKSQSSIFVSSHHKTFLLACPRVQLRRSVEVEGVSFGVGVSTSFLLAPSKPMVM